MEKARMSVPVRRAIGQYFTPTSVAAFALRALQELAAATLPRRLRLIDPACGEGVFLREALSCGLVSPDGRRDALIGLDVDARLRERWREGGLETCARLRVADGLLDCPEIGVTADSFDVVVGNPPMVAVV